MLCVVGSRFPTPPLFSLFLLTVSRERAAALSRMDRQTGRKFFCFFSEKRIDILIIAYYNNTTLRASQHAPVAQLDRVFGYEPKGRGFESLLAYHVGASFVSLAPTFFKVRARSRRCSDAPLIFSALNISIFSMSSLSIRGVSLRARAYFHAAFPGCSVPTSPCSGCPSPF